MEKRGEVSMGFSQKWREVREGSIFENNIKKHPRKEKQISARGSN